MTTARGRGFLNFIKSWQIKSKNLKRYNHGIYHNICNDSNWLGDMGMSLSIASIGSAIGTGIAGMAAIGAWKKMIISGQKTATALLIFVGAPLSQVIYGMILKNAIADANLASDSYLCQMMIGLAAGAAMGGSAIFQRRAGARACDAIASGLMIPQNTPWSSALWKRWLCSS